MTVAEQIIGVTNLISEFIDTYPLAAFLIAAFGLTMVAVVYIGKLGIPGSISFGSGTDDDDDNNGDDD